MNLVWLLPIALGLCLVMALAWVTQRRTGNSGWADVYWSFGTGVAGAAAALIPAHGLSDRQILIALSAALWGIRLGTHIRARTLSGIEDGRYAKLRKEWGDGFQRRLFWFLQIQAVAALPLALTVLAAAHNPAPDLEFGDIAGLIVLILALGGEALADAQLRRFKADPGKAGAICDVGLWSLSRHPNYFCEWLVWVAYAIVALWPSGQAYPMGWLGLIGPVLMYWLLVYVSGIPPLEEHMLAARGDAFRAYQQRTAAFFPVPAFFRRKSTL